MTARDSELLHRIMSFRHVVNLFETKCLRLSMPETWDDPYERLVTYSRQELLFAQCWSRHASSDALWRIYSSDRMGMCIRTTRARLASAMEETRRAVPLDFRIDDVEYMPDEDAVKQASELVHYAEARGDVSQGVLASLFVKRAAFEHEAEVRLAVHLGERRDDYSPQLLLAVDPHALIDRIEFDPRVDGVFSRMCTHYLRNVVGFLGEIATSRLYDGSDTMIIV